MKRLYTILTLLAMMAITAQAQVLSPQQALSRAKGTPTMKRAQATASAYQLVRTIEADGDAALYVFQSTDDCIVLSAEADAHAVLARFDMADTDVDNLPEAAQMMLDSYAAEIAAYRAQTIKAAASDDETRADIAPMIASKWGMDSPFNKNLPEGITHDNGTVMIPSVAVAMAQVMKFHQWPVTGKGSYECTVINNKATNYAGVRLSMDFSTYTIDWDNMLDEYKPLKYNSTQVRAATDLLSAVGISLNTRYNTGTISTASVGRVPLALTEYFGYDKSALNVSRTYFSDDEWEDMVYAQLANGHPVIYGGVSGTSGSSATDKSHAMVCDGYKDNMFHLNFGWMGEGDGFYRLNAMDLDDVDGGPEWHKNGYTYNQYMVYNIIPDREGTSTQYTQLILSGEFNVETVQNGLQVNGSFVNVAVYPADVTFGLCIANDDDGETKYITGEKFEGNAAIRVNTYNVAVDALADGTYRLYPAYCMADGEWHLARITSFANQYVILHVNGGEMTIETLPDIYPEARVAKCNNAVYANGVPNQMTFTVYNPSPYRAFDGYIASYFLDDDGNIIAEENAAHRISVGMQRSASFTYKAQYVTISNDNGEGTGTGGDTVEGKTLNFRLALVTTNGELIAERIAWISEPIRLWFGLEDDPTQPDGKYDGITTVSNNQPTMWYDMHGRQVANPKSGLYINSRGQKTIIR